MTHNGNPNRFDYVKYDEEAIKLQDIFKVMMKNIEQATADLIVSPRAKALALTKLEEAYMWMGKGIRDDLLVRQPHTDQQEERKDG